MSLKEKKCHRSVTGKISQVLKGGNKKNPGSLEGRKKIPGLGTKNVTGPTIRDCLSRYCLGHRGNDQYPYCGLNPQ